MGAAAHWRVRMPSWRCRVNERADQDRCAGEGFRSWTGKMWGREHVIRAFAGIGEASAQEGAYGLDQRVGAWCWKRDGYQLTV
jgi:hypothetical protein